MDATPLAERVGQLVDRIRDLAPPNPRNPDRYHEEKSEIAGDLEIVRQMMSGEWTVPVSKKAPPEPIKPGRRVINGTVIQVDFRNRRSAKAAH